MEDHNPHPPGLPNQTPRPEGELETLKRVWKTPTGWRLPSAVNNTVIGALYIGAAFWFFVIAGILALLMRTQLAVPENSFLSQEMYNQIFTVHGTTMMFLFAVPAVEAAGVLLLPQMFAARDLPFPRLSAFAIWAYVIGGTVFVCSLLFKLAPHGGWFMYPPLTLKEFSPGDNADFWLLGIGFIEISAIAGAIEIIVGTLRTRPPGMSLDKMPIFAWTMLIFAGMIVFAFPAVILATLMLEIERTFGWPFFEAATGGDPLLWQHLFWFFGHPEVYIIFLPAAGMISMIVPTMARTPLVGYRLIVVALIATGFFSFGLWVHHMFTTGIPALSSGFFSAASMAVAVPSGIQVFAWIATIAAARGRFRLTTPGLFVLGFLFIFTLGGLSGVMVAMVPFDWQVHDTYFVVAHFHYVLVGGMVFPLFAAFYYWAPMMRPRRLSEALGRWVFALMFIGFNVAFFPMHLSGLIGMPRRVWTYPDHMGWGGLNMVSTAGAFILAAGVALFIFDVIRSLTKKADAENNPWGAGSLEWLPNAAYAMRSIPHVTSREPLWDQPNLPEDVKEGRYYLPGTVSGGRETLITSPIDAQPQYVARMPGAGWTPVLAALFTATFFLLLTVKLVTPAVAAGVLAILFCILWVWRLDRGAEKGEVEIGAGIKLPDYVTGPLAHGWWAMVILMLVAGSLYFAYVFSYLYLWTVSPDVWAYFASPPPPDLLWPLASAALLAGAVGLSALSGRTLAAGGSRGLSALLLAASISALCGGVGVEILGQWSTGLRPAGNAYGALVYMASFLNAELVFAVAVMGLFILARFATGRVDKVRRAGFQNTVLLLNYTAFQSLGGLILIHGFPRLMAGG